MFAKSLRLCTKVCTKDYAHTHKHIRHPRQVTVLLPKGGARRPPPLLLLTEVPSYHKRNFAFGRAVTSSPCRAIVDAPIAS